MSFALEDSLSSPGPTLARRSQINTSAWIGLMLLFMLTRAIIISLSHPELPAVTPELSPKPQLERQTKIDLLKFYNAKLSDSWLNPEWGGNTLERLHEGCLLTKGVAFDVHGIIQLQGVDLNKINTSFPTEVPNIPIGRNFRRLFLLHGTSWSTVENRSIAFLRLLYKDGQTARIPIRFGRHVRDWWSRIGDLTATPSSWVAWEGDNPRAFRDVKLKLYATAFENPRPNREVISLDYCSEMTRSAPFILALTVE